MSPTGLGRGVGRIDRCPQGTQRFPQHVERDGGGTFADGRRGLPGKSRVRVTGRGTSHRNGETYRADRLFGRTSPGPAMPVVAIATSASNCRRAPRPSPGDRFGPRAPCSLGDQRRIHAQMLRLFAALGVHHRPAHHVVRGAGSGRSAERRSAPRQDRRWRSSGRPAARPPDRRSGAVGGQPRG